MEEIIIPIFGIVFTFGTAFGIIYIIFTSRNRERMAMIERGMDPGISRSEADPMRSLRNGLLFLGAGVGLLAGWLFEHFLMGDENGSPLPYIIGVAIFGGLAQVLYYLKFGGKQGT
jgi:drug/metabolite transporter (DMT)-like permease